MKTNLIHADTIIDRLPSADTIIDRLPSADIIVDRLPIDSTLEAVDDLMTETVPDIIAAGTSSGRSALRHLSRATSRVPQWGWLMVGGAAVALIALLFWRRRIADRASESSRGQASSTERPRRVA